MATFLVLFIILKYKIHLSKQNVKLHIIESNQYIVCYNYTNVLDITTQWYNELFSFKTKTIFHKPK